MMHKFLRVDNVSGKNIISYFSKKILNYNTEGAIMY